MAGKAQKRRPPFAHPLQPGPRDRDSISFLARRLLRARRAQRDR